MTAASRASPIAKETRSGTDEQGDERIEQLVKGDRGVRRALGAREPVGSDVGETRRGLRRAQPTLGVAAQLVGDRLGRTCVRRKELRARTTGTALIARAVTRR